MLPFESARRRPEAREFAGSRPSRPGAILLTILTLTLAGCGANLPPDTQSGLVSTPNSAALKPTSAADGAITTGAIASPAKAESGDPKRQLTQLAEKYTAGSTPGSVDYKIGPQDVLDISVFKVPDLSRSVQVADAGTVNLPLVGEIQAVGKTARDIEHDVAAKLGAKYLQAPQVTVYIKEYNSQRVTVDGAVKKPGVYPIRGKTTLLQSVALAQGLNEVSDSSDIVVFRQEDNKRTAARFDLEEIRQGRVDDPALRAGDVVIVNESAGKAAFQAVLKALPITSMFVPIL